MISDLNECLVMISDKHFFIKDEASMKKSIVVKENSQFEVINNTDKKIGFLAIDGCIYDSGGDSRCDCAIFDENVFCFIELKVCKIKAQKKNRVKADEQLKNTIINLKNEDIVKNKKLEAYACLNCKTDDKLTRITKAKNSDTILKFEDELDTSLHYTCTKEFN